MERVRGIEPLSPTWKAGVIAIIRYPQAICGPIFADLKSLRKGEFLELTRYLHDHRLEVASFWEREEFSMIDIMSDPFDETDLFPGTSGSDAEHRTEVFWRDATGARTCH